ncbi:MAG: serine hydrolase domain-containing protein [Pyrinomonadaceae bacterium]
MRVLASFLTMTILSGGALAQTAANLERERFEAAAAYSREHRGVSMIVMKGDKVVFEDDRGGFTKDLPWILASGTKSFVGVMCAAAIDDKLISGFDEKVADTITEWKSDPRKSKITIRQLLSLTSGIEAGQIGSVPTYAQAVKRPAKHEPGKHFQYGPVPFQIFGEVMKRKLEKKKESVMAYLKRRILDPVDLNISNWRTSGEEQPILSQGLMLTAREWAKFGVFLKDGGKWKGKQIISSKLLDELTVGTKTNPAYGLTFWLNADGTGPSGDARPGISGDIGRKKLTTTNDVFMAAGAGNQRLYVIRSQDLVVVRFGIFGGFNDGEFISKLLPGK